MVISGLELVLGAVKMMVSNGSSVLEMMKTVVTRSHDSESWLMVSDDRQWLMNDDHAHRSAASRAYGCSTKHEERSIAAVKSSAIMVNGC